MTEGAGLLLPREHPLARVLEAQRGRFNALFAQARRATPHLDPAAFLEHVATALAPVAAAVNVVAPERTADVVDVLYEVSLTLVAREFLGPRARDPQLARGWGRALTVLARHPAAEPRRCAGAITNALYHLAQVPGARPGAWLAGLETLGRVSPDVATLLAGGQVLAWRAGLAHFRPQALEIARRLPATVARSALGLGDQADPAAALDRLAADPWLPPEQAGQPPAPGPVRIAAMAGGFRGFGGPFLRPPRVGLVAGQFVAGDGEGNWVLTADACGATFHRTGTAPPEAAALGPWKIDRKGQVGRGGKGVRFAELADWVSAAGDATTLAVTVPLSHRVFLLTGGAP